MASRNLAQHLAIAALRLYQRTLSPDHSWLKHRRIVGACRYLPTCSDYAIQAIAEYGFWRGSWLAAKRLSRCTPFHTPKYDPVPHSHP